MDFISMSLSRPKMIDLAGFGLNDTVFELFANGGGKTTVDNTEKTKAFWTAVSGRRPVRFLIDASAMGLKLSAEANSRTFNGTGAIQAIEVSFLIYSGGAFRVTVLFGLVNAGTGTEVVVAVETVPEPSE